jgi:uncharacterized metal-binding protein YceD (DUF177 family)
MTQAHDSPHSTDNSRAQVPCPYCGATETEPLALFGQQLLTVQMYCQRCHTPFEYVKDDAILAVFEARQAREADEAHEAGAARKGDQS